MSHIRPGSGSRSRQGLSPSFIQITRGILIHCARVTITIAAVVIRFNRVFARVIFIKRADSIVITRVPAVVAAVIKVSFERSVATITAGGLVIIEAFI